VVPRPPQSCTGRLLEEEFVIHRLSPRRKRWGIAALAAAVLGTPLIAATATNPAAGAEPTNPAIELVAPEKVTAYTYGRGIYSTWASGSRSKMLRSRSGRSARPTT